MNKPIGWEIEDDHFEKQGREVMIQWVYNSIQSVGKSQQRLLYLLLTIFVFGLALDSKSSSEIKIPMFEVYLERSILLHVYIIASFLLIVAYYAALNTMNHRLADLKQMTKYSGTLDKIDCNYTFIDFLSLSNKFSYFGVRFGVALMPLLLSTVLIFAWYSMIGYVFEVWSNCCASNIFLLFIEFICLVIAIGSIYSICKNTCLNYKKTN